jgi:hypothetical protein
MNILKYIFSGILFLLVSTSNSFSQKNDDLPQNLIQAFKQGNNTSLSDYFGERVQLSIQDKEAFYSKQQAKQIIAKFFKDFPPTDFKKRHIGGKVDARYVTGDLQTKNGNFRVSFLLKNQDNKLIIHQLNIEKD